MTFLPIAERELRVSARGKAAHRLRILFAISAVVIAGSIGSFSLANGGVLAPQMGMVIFGALKWVGFIFACGAGVFLTADCLSEEKRDGTLGLLFLTDLHGYDVVLGKLCATSLRCFYSLLAIFPVMAFSFILGGVDADDFRHTFVVLCNTLFFSLAVGMFISVLSRDSNKAMTACLTLLLLALFIPSQLDKLLLGRNAGNPLLALSSPFYAISNTDTFHSREFWRSALILNLDAWGFLAIASWLVPTSWQEKGIRGSLATRFQLPFVNHRSRRSNEKKLLEQSPIAWFISRDRWAPMLARVGIFVILGLFVLSLIPYFIHATKLPARQGSVTSSTFTRKQTAAGSTTTYSFRVDALGMITGSAPYRIAARCSPILAWALEFWLVAHVARFYIEGKRNGLLELLVVTPTTLSDIIRGHWIALRRLFSTPVVAQVFLMLAVGAIPVLAEFTTPSPTATPSPGVVSNLNMTIQQFLAILIGAVAWITSLVALAWISIWMALTSKKTAVAMLKTFSYVQFLPWFGVYLLVGLSFGIILSRISLSNAPWLPGALFQFVPPALIIGVNFALIRLARAKVSRAFSTWTVSQ